ncbi:MAG: GTP-binding protein [Verrucomicrobiota bacterium]
MKELTKLITRLETGAPLPADLRQKPQRAHILGITGPPGVGKSTLIDRLIEVYRRAKKTVAVVVIDPSSPLSGGALLGDRLRMQRHSDDPGVFIRSLATRRHPGGLTKETPAIVQALAATFAVVIIETVGAGQNDVAIADVADTVVVVLMPELGDEIQRAKSGLMEIADIVVTNKSDLGRVTVGLAVSAKTGAGVETLANMILQRPRRSAQCRPE